MHHIKLLCNCKLFRHAVMLPRHLVQHLFAYWVCYTLNSAQCWFEACGFSLGDLINVNCLVIVGADLLLIKKDGFSLLNWKLRYQFLVLVDFRSAL